MLINLIVYRLCRQNLKTSFRFVQQMRINSFFFKHLCYDLLHIRRNSVQLYISEFPFEVSYSD